MFVSPPPSSAKQLLPGLLWRKRLGELVPINEDDAEGGATKEFIHAPSEYASRARAEVRRRVLQPREVQRRWSDDRESVSSSEASAQGSLFSRGTLGTRDSQVSSVGPLRMLRLEEALPTMFYDMYAPEILMRPQELLPNGRPKFTKRELLDWDLNDIRSLLIVERLRDEWGGVLPTIWLDTGGSEQIPQFRLQLLELDSPDETIIETLVTSDIYKEARLDYEFKLASARYTVMAARKRHTQMVGVEEPIMRLSKPEWRNIIENYLLNLAVEAQCHFDFRNAYLELQRHKQAQLKESVLPPSMLPQKHCASASLLKRALLRGTYQRQQRQQKPANITQTEKSQLWSQCQAAVYQRLGLDWAPDNI